MDVVISFFSWTYKRVLSPYIYVFIKIQSEVAYYLYRDSTDKREIHKRVYLRARQNFPRYVCSRAPFSTDPAVRSGPY
ncbi:hypothetical protein Nepgr_010382 [Nepenthes gracilis]|uniref:Uncharacterized protein n=1 Tax=Nepenthes gracilis TaxID=150966 RepID=A0AAD3SCL4_NEPGR|nr:hypothetical protein Nepgr_010382 [Nepenthes gracilis]